MGLRASIYRDARLGDCSNGGISGRVDRVTIVNIDGPFEPRDDAPAVMLVRGNVPGAVKIVPAIMYAGAGGWMEDRPDGMIGPMMGGCYVATSDARLREAVTKLGSRTDAVPLHDRFETQAQYDALSI